MVCIEFRKTTEGRGEIFRLVYCLNQEDVDSDYLFGKFLHGAALCSAQRSRILCRVRKCVLENDRFREHPLKCNPLHRLRDLRFSKTFLETLFSKSHPYSEF